MKREDLANEIRSAGNAVRFADGPVIGGSFRNGKFVAMHSARAKLKTPDWKVIRQASTCSECDAVASKRDRELAQEMADCYQSFARLIWPCIDHAEYCTAEPYISVSESAGARFAKLKEKFEAQRQARERREDAGQPARSGTASKGKGKTKKSKKRMSDADIMVHEIMLALSANMKRKAGGKATQKKAVAGRKPTKKPKAATKKKRAATKKSPKKKKS